MDTPLFIANNAEYAIQMRRGGNHFSPYKVDVKPFSPAVKNSDRNQARVCTAYTGYPVACLDQATSQVYARQGAYPPRFSQYRPLYAKD
jgi:hypothetical protein